MKGNVYAASGYPPGMLSGLGKLALIQFRIKTAPLQKFGVRSTLNDAPFIHDEDLVGLEDGREAVRDHDGGAPAECNFERPLDGGLGFGIQMRGRLVENDDFGRFEKQAGNGQTLLLASREAIPTVAHQRVEALRQGGDERAGSAPRAMLR